MFNENAYEIKKKKTVCRENIKFQLKEKTISFTLCFTYGMLLVIVCLDNSELV